MKKLLLLGVLCCLFSSCDLLDSDHPTGDPEKDAKTLCKKTKKMKEEADEFTEECFMYYSMKYGTEVAGQKLEQLMNIFTTTCFQW